uniref:SFRICE_029220 n=1 Tax=Spodoptera frugiperda TaxID=7108 RepID=A0A2H1W902_SPOFR
MVWLERRCSDKDRKGNVTMVWTCRKSTTRLARWLGNWLPCKLAALASLFATGSMSPIIFVAAPIGGGGDMDLKSFLLVLSKETQQLTF